MQRLGTYLVLTVDLPNAHTLVTDLLPVPLHDGQDVSVRSLDQGVICVAKTALGQFEVLLELTSGDIPLVHYRTTFTPARILSLSPQPLDLLLLKGSGALPRAGTVHLEQVQARSGACFVDFGAGAKGSLYYFQNLSALHAYAEDIQSSLADCVKVRWPQLGLQLPTVSGKGLSKGKPYVLRDTYLLYFIDTPKRPAAIALQILQAQCRVYRQLQTPVVSLYAIDEFVQHSLRDLAQHKGCWQQVKADAFLNAYLNDYQNPPESMVQLSVLLPVLRYHLAYPNATSAAIVDTLLSGVSCFYDEKIQSIARWMPEKTFQLDESEEQKQPRIMDAWYLHQPLLNLAYVLLAGKGDDLLKQQFINSVTFCKKVAKHFDYVWPVFYDLDTLDILKAEAAPGDGGEKDVGGLYAFLMLRAHELTGDPSYLDEAKRAARSLSQFGHEVLYQANNTAYAAEALLELWTVTGDTDFLKQSELCLANLLRNTAIWDMQYGHAKEYSSFLMLFPLKDAPYAAVYEEQECMASFSRYLHMAHRKKAPLSAEIQTLLPELVKHILGRLACYYPPMLPDDVLAQEVKTGYLDKNRWIPVEDLGDGWDPVGTVGQEVYGAGALFQAFVNQALPLGNNESYCFVGYPIVEKRAVDGGVRFRTAGSSTLSYPIRLLGRPKKRYQLTAGKDVLWLDADNPVQQLPGGTTITLRWKS